jgi:hypothetical protein
MNDDDREFSGLGGLFGAEQAALQPGLKAVQDVSATPKPTGVMLRFFCQTCGQPADMEIEYPEVVALKYGVNPAIAFRQFPNMVRSATRWEFRPDENGWLPDISCKVCSRKVEVIVEPHEPERFLQGARRRGFINTAGEAQVSQLCAKMAQGGAGVRR